MSFSKTQVIGRLTKDPEVKQVQVRGENQTVANFSVACDRNYGDGTDFYDVVVWRKTAENVGKYLSKGREVFVEGRMQKRSYTASTPEGAQYQRDVWELHGETIQFLGGGNGGNNGGNGGGYQQNNQNNQSAEAPVTPSYSGPAPF